MPYFLFFPHSTMQKRLYVVSASHDSLCLGFLQEHHVTLIKGAVLSAMCSYRQGCLCLEKSLYLTPSQQLFLPILPMASLIVLIYDFVAICLFVFCLTSSSLQQYHWPSHGLSSFAHEALCIYPALPHSS